jgi:hypothetical protein
MPWATTPAQRPPGGRVAGNTGRDSGARRPVQAQGVAVEPRSAGHGQADSRLAHPGSEACSLGRIPLEPCNAGCPIVQQALKMVDRRIGLV